MQLKVESFNNISHPPGAHLLLHTTSLLIIATWTWTTTTVLAAIALNSTENVAFEVNTELQRSRKESSQKWADDDEYDRRRPQRRRYEEPNHVKLQNRMLAIATSVRNPINDLSYTNTSRQG